MPYTYDEEVTYGSLVPPPAADEEQSEHVIVPPDALQDETLRQLAVEFLLREAGQDLSEAGITDERVERVLKAIRVGTHLITFDPKTESAGIMEAKLYRQSHQT